VSSVLKETREGTVPFDIGDETAETWFRVTGDLGSDDFA
jgi:hypothetical protein